MSGFSEAATPKHSYTNPSKKQDLAHLEADGKKYDEEGNELDKHGSVSYTHLTLPTILLV